MLYFATILHLRLNRSHPYRFFAAVLLLTLYAFAATPVQFWHDHKSQEAGRGMKASIAIERNALSGTIIAKATLSSDQCGICSHQYSAYAWDDPYLTEAPLAMPGVLSPSSSNSLYRIFTFHFSNKSPPATA